MNKSIIAKIGHCSLLVYLALNSVFASPVTWAASDADKIKVDQFRAVKDPAVCEQATGHLMVSNDLADGAKTFCYRNLAINTGDAQWCGHLPAFQAMDCVTQLAVAAKDPDLCKGILQVMPGEGGASFDAKRFTSALGCEGRVLKQIANPSFQESANALLPEDEPGAYAKCKTQKNKRAQDECFARLGDRFFWGSQQQAQNRPIPIGLVVEECINKFSPDRFRMCILSRSERAHPLAFPAFKNLISTNEKARSIYCEKYRSSFGLPYLYDENDKIDTPLRKEFCKEKPNP